MESQDLAKRLKTQYPDYAEIPDEELVAKVTAKFPDYADFVSQGDTSPAATENGAINISSPPAVETAPVQTPPAMVPTGKGKITAQEIDALLNSEHGDKIRNFFGAIKQFEGGQPDLIVGGKMRFDPRGDHPNKVGLVTKQGKSTAAGDFQNRTAVAQQVAR